MLFMKWYIIQYDADGPWFVRKIFTPLGSSRVVNSYPYIKVCGPYKTEQDAVSMYLLEIRE